MSGFSNFSIEPFSGTWTEKQAAHLLRRTTYGVLQEDIDDATSEGMQNIVSRLLEDQSLPNPPINYNYEEDPNVPIGASWVNQPYIRSENNRQVNTRLSSLRAWILGLAMEEGISIREKMTLFWQNHFVTGDIRDANYAYGNNTLLRQHALGNFRELTKKVTIDPAMLRYLNGNQNTKFSPNENYARELLELFTIGKGPQVGDGDYTNYTETDVAAIAKVLTGWRDIGYFSRDGQSVGVTFRPFAHDLSTKKLSHRFDEIEIPNQGVDEYINLIDIIFQKEEVSNFLVRKLYRWFVYYDIDENIEENIIRPLAQILRDNDFEIKPVLETLLQSSHFYDDYASGSIIKNPLDFVVGLVRQLKLDFGTELLLKYRLWNRLYNFVAFLQMDYFTPPNVAGWKAYYQEPLYYRTWINSTTLSSRFLLSSLLIYGQEMDRSSLKANVLTMIESLPGADDPNLLIKEISQYLLPETIAAGQTEYLKSILLPGLPDYEWTVEYNEYLANPSDEELKNAVENRLRAMFLALLSLPEYQLS